MISICKNKCIILEKKKSYSEVVNAQEIVKIFRLVAKLQLFVYNNSITLKISELIVGHYRPSHTLRTAYLRWGVPKTLRCIKIASDRLQCIFQHVGNLAPNFGIFQLFTVRFSSGFQQNEGYWIYFLLVKALFVSILVVFFRLVI